ncbi:uncharacterized protein IWZ02DRAFT_176660 [Phyllosticta citriasiana]|uniref:Uncharacterized protein n=1 Tax=Phyllosticta citriasiana TaxID=595635 RepID=A0ABR1KHC3_9PEZI
MSPYNAQAQSYAAHFDSHDRYLARSFGIKFSTKMPYYSEYAAARGSARDSITQLDDQSEDSFSETCHSAAKDDWRPKTTQSTTRNQPHSTEQPHYVWVWHRAGRSDCLLGRWLDILTGRGPTIRIEARGPSKDVRPALKLQPRDTGEAAKDAPHLPSSFSSELGTSTSKSSSKSGRFADADWQRSQDAHSALHDTIRRQSVRCWLQRKRR